MDPPAPKLPGPAPSQGNLSVIGHLSTENQAAWLQVAALSEALGDWNACIYAYENVIRHNPEHVRAMSQLAMIYRHKERFDRAIALFSRVLEITPHDGEIWGALGHCYLVVGDLEHTYHAYHQALQFLPDNQDPNLWFGIGVLYDRFASYDLAIQAFMSVLRTDRPFEKIGDVYLRMGVIFKKQGNFQQAFEYLQYVRYNNPNETLLADVMFQLGHTYLLQGDTDNAKISYDQTLSVNANHAKALKHLGWLSMQNGKYNNLDAAASLLTRSAEADPEDPQTWYLLGRLRMSQRLFRPAYDSFQQAVSRDSKNAAFWRAIGILYYEINQYRDVLDALTRAIQIDSSVPEVWWDLATLYETCGQYGDAVQALERARNLGSNSLNITGRLNLLYRSAGGQQSRTESVLLCLPPLPLPTADSVHTPPSLDSTRAKPPQDTTSTQPSPSLAGVHPAVSGGRVPGIPPQPDPMNALGQPHSSPFQMPQQHPGAAFPLPRAPTHNLPGHPANPSPSTGAPAATQPGQGGPRKRSPSPSNKAAGEGGEGQSSKFARGEDGVRIAHPPPFASSPHPPAATEATSNAEGATTGSNPATTTSDESQSKAVASEDTARASTGAQEGKPAEGQTTVTDAKDKRPSPALSDDSDVLHMDKPKTTSAGDTSPAPTKSRPAQ